MIYITLMLIIQHIEDYKNLYYDFYSHIRIFINIDTLLYNINDNLILRFKNIVVFF